MTTNRAQLNVRVSAELERAIDEKRVALRNQFGSIPSRSDVLRLALAEYLNFDIQFESDRRSTTGPSKRKGSG